jgi:hypothetical protein
LETELEDAIAHRRRTKAEPTSEEKAEFYSARRSLKINRLGLTAVQQRRGLLISAAKAEYQRDGNRRLLDLLKECNPSVFWWLSEVFPANESFGMYTGHRTCAGGAPLRAGSKHRRRCRAEVMGQY